MQETRSLMLIN